MNKFLIDQVLKEYFTAWADKNNWVILDCSNLDTPALREYAIKQNALVVDDPRGLTERVLVVLPKLKD